MTLEGEHLLSGVPLPEPDRQVPGGAGQALAVGPEGHAKDTIGVSLEGEELAAAVRLPDPHHLVRRGAGQAPAVGAEGHARSHEQRSGNRPEQCRLRRVAPAPAPTPPQRTQRPGSNRLAFLKAAQVVSQGLGRGVALARVLLEALQADGFQVPLHLRVEGPGRHGLALQHVPQRIHRRVRAERRSAGE